MPANQVAETTYRQVIGNALSGVENLPASSAIDYLREEWEPFARDVLATGDAALREFGTLGGQPVIGPVAFQGGVIFLHGYGCTHCGNGFWTEGGDERRLAPGSVHSCPHCGAASRVAGERSGSPASRRDR